MKQIVAIAQPHRPEAIEEALHALERLPGFTVFTARGHPRGRVLETVRAIARTGHPGDGRIAVFDVEDIVNIRTGERGDAAL
jgi:nitrogen regulatory protein P-II 1